MQWTTLKFGELSKHHIDSWDTLHRSETAFRSPFTTYEFCRAVDRTLGEVSVSFLESKSIIRAIFPFQYRSHSALGIAEKPGGHLSDYFGIVGGSQFNISERELLKAANLSVFNFDHLPVQESMLPLRKGSVSYGIRIEIGNHSEYMEHLRMTNKKVVKQVERSIKQLSETRGEVHFEWNTAEARELEQLICEKRRQYSLSGVQDALHPAWARNLLSELIHASTKNCEAILSTVYCGDMWVASNLALRNHDILHIWFPVFNPLLRRFGPGHILFFSLFEAAATKGVKTIDFGGGTSAYKRKYAGHEYALFKGSLRRTGILSAAHLLAQSVSWRLGLHLHRANKIQTR